MVVEAPRAARSDRVHQEDAPRTTESQSFVFPTTTDLPCLGRYNFEAADPRRGACLHLYLCAGSRDKPTNDEWKRFIRLAAKSADTLQAAWPGTSESGEVFTKHNSTPLNGGRGRYPTIELTVREGWRFYDQNDDEQWDRWAAFKPTTPNRFSKEQVERLKSTDLPWHSEFYDRYRLVGVVSSASNGRNFGIVDFYGVSELRLCG